MLEKSYMLRDVLQTLNITTLFQDEAEIIEMGAKSPTLTQVTVRLLVCLSVCCLSLIRPSVCLSVCLFVCLTDQFTCLQVYQKSAVSVSDSSEELITGGRASTFSDPPPRLTINRPFIFIIYHEMSGSVLLVGRVSNPTSQ